LQLDLEVAHLQHGIRGEEAREDARFTAELAERLGLPFHLKEVSVPEIRTAAGRGNLEALARDERFRFFAELVRDRGLNKVATAHTQDDQAETVLMWFLRGSGLTGLGGMAPLYCMKSAGVDLSVIRPLLETSKAELLEYLSETGQSFRLDCTNQDPRLLRNWIRLELLPKIRERVDERLSERLGQQAELLRDEDRLLTDMAVDMLQKVRNGNEVRRHLFLAQPAAMQRRLLRLWITERRGNLRGVDFVHIEELRRLIDKGPPHGRLALPGGWELAREYDRLKLVRRQPRLKRQCYAYDFAAGSTLRIAEAGWEIRSEFIQPPLEHFPTDLTEAVFDAACLTGPLIVRNFRNGDFLQPLGMPGHRKIKDLFIEQKLPLAQRATMPLLVIGREVLWVPGSRRSERAKVTNSTALILRLKLVSLNP
jgi:tRNA(Ile)-lysidine synthase